jgi:hypothetical protein
VVLGFCYNLWFQILKIKGFPILDFKKRIQNKITNQFKALEKKFKRRASERNWQFKLGSLTSSFDSLFRTLVLGQDHIFDF